METAAGEGAHFRLSLPEAEARPQNGKSQWRQGLIAWRQDFERHRFRAVLRLGEASFQNAPQERRETPLPF